MKEQEENEQSLINPKECLGVKPLCPNGRIAQCNTQTGEWVCPAIIAELEIENEIE